MDQWITPLENMAFLCGSKSGNKSRGNPKHFFCGLEVEITYVWSKELSYTQKQERSFIYPDEYSDSSSNKYRTTLKGSGYVYCMTEEPIHPYGCIILQQAIANTMT